MTTTSMNLDDVEHHLDNGALITAELQTAAQGVDTFEDTVIAACDGAPAAVVDAALGMLDMWDANTLDLRSIWSTLSQHDGTLNTSALSGITGIDVPDGSYSPFDDAMFSLEQIRDLLDTARQDDDNNRGTGSAESDQVWSVNDLKAMADNDDGYYTDAQVEHAKKVLAMIEASPEAREYLGITESGGGWSLSDIGHLTLDIFGMVPIVGNAADGINAAWYAAEGKYLDAALSSMALLPVIGQGVTLAKPAIKAAARGKVFNSVEEALAWAKKWWDDFAGAGRNAPNPPPGLSGYPRVGSATKADAHHAFPDLIDNIATDGSKFTIPTRGPGGAVVRNSELYQVPGSLNGRDGVFEWIIDAGEMTHRRFIPGGTVTGVPNQVPGR